MLYFFNEQFFNDPHERVYSLKNRRGVNQIANPHDFWDELGDKLADMAVSGKWFGNMESNSGLFDKTSNKWKSNNTL